MLTFAERVLGDPRQPRRSLPVTKKARLQRAIFPDGLVHDGSAYRTPVTGGAFALCAELAGERGEWRALMLPARTPFLHVPRTPPWRRVQRWISELERVRAEVGVAA